MKLPKKQHSLMRAGLVCVLVFSLTIANFAWNKPGHMVTGAIAARELKNNDPQALAAVVALLKRHPSYRSVWRPIVNQRNGLDDEAVVLFAYAARWPDDARGTSDHREQWHFINFPFKPDGQPSSVRTADPAATNIENAFQANVGVLRNPQSTDVQKAKALAWLFHLTGDTHQPLHTSALFTTVFPEGDRGGTRFFVRVRNGNRTNGVKLHALWDNFVIDNENFGAIHDSYLDLLADIERSDLTNVNETDQPQWVQESFVLAKEQAYLNGRLRGALTAGRAVEPPSGYINDSKRRARERMTLAGYRLADLMSRLF
jgi:hypothetical protein